MRALAETIEKALRDVQSRQRAELEASAEGLLGQLAEQRRRVASETARHGEARAVGSGLGPLGRSTIRTDVFAELQRDADAAKPGASRGARLEALEGELSDALAELRAHAPDVVFEDLATRGHRDSFTETLKQHEARQAPVVTLLGKVRAAQLHVAALYREEVHDPTFDAFGLHSLDEDERRFLAPLAFVAVDESTGLELPSIGHLVDAPLPVIVVRACTLPLPGAADTTRLPLPYSALAFSPQWTWLQTTWHLESDELPPLLAELVAGFERMTGPAFIDVLGCETLEQVEWVEACGVWPSLAYVPGDVPKADAWAPIVQLSPAPADAARSPASFAWELLGASPLAPHFVELDEATRRSGGKPLEDYLALSREERQSYFPFFVADGVARLVPPDVLRYCEQLGHINRIWRRLGSAAAAPVRERPREVPATAARPEPTETTVPDEALRAALERILNRLIDIA